MLGGMNMLPLLGFALPTLTAAASESLATGASAATILYQATRSHHDS